MRKHKIKRLFVMHVFILCLLGLAACGSLTTENYQKLEMGMPMEAVKEILGEADSCNSTLGAASCLWGNENRYIKVKFVADKVVFYSSKGL